MSDIPTTSVFWKVELDVPNLSHDWTSCKGLGMSIGATTVPDTAMSVLQHHWAGPVSYPNIVLGGYVTSATDKLLAWLSSFTMLPVPTTAQITALDQSGDVVFSWSLFGVIPVKYTGPSFASDSPQAATHELEVAHKGFLT